MFYRLGAKKYIALENVFCDFPDYSTKVFPSFVKKSVCIREIASCCCVLCDNDSFIYIYCTAFIHSRTFALQRSTEEEKRAMDEI